MVKNFEEVGDEIAACSLRGLGGGSESPYPL